MPIVNYVREHIRFMEYATDEHLSASERLLWYALMHIFNQRAQGKVWPEEFIRISNDRLLSYCPMKYDTIAAARNGLKQRGLIEFTPGEKNKKSPAYRMIYFYPEYAAPDTESDTDEVCYPKKSDYTGGNTGDNMGYNNGGNTGGNAGDNIINFTGTKNVTLQGKREEEEEPFPDAGAAKAAARAWRQYFGREATPAALAYIERVAESCEMGDDMVALAIKNASIRMAESPAEYAATLLADWDRHGVTDPEKAGIYEADRAKRREG